MLPAEGVAAMKLRYNGFLLLAAAMLLTGMLAVGCSTTQKASDAQDNVSETVSAAQPGEDSEQGGGNKVSVPTAPEGTIFGAQKITSDEFLNLIAEKKYVSPAKFGLVLYYDYAKLPVLSDGKTFFLTVDSDRTEGESWATAACRQMLTAHLRFWMMTPSPGWTVSCAKASRCAFM